VCPSTGKFRVPHGVELRTRVPTELIGKTSSRLYWLAMVVLVTTIILFVTRHFLDPTVRPLERQLVFILDISLLILTSLVVIVIHRMGFLPPNRVLELGLAYEVVVSFEIAMLEFIRGQAGHFLVGISTVPMWILAYGIFVPNTPARTLIGALISAGTGPLAYVVSRSLLNLPPWEASELALWFVPSVLMAGWTYFLSRD